MKFRLLFTLLSLIFGSVNLRAQPAEPKTLDLLVSNFMMKHDQVRQVSFKEEIAMDTIIELQLYHLSEDGFIIVSNNMQLPPVVAYSFENDFDAANEPGKSVIQILGTDMTNRLIYQNHTENRRNIELWNDLISHASRSVTFQQWPPEGSTPTGGWVTTNWTQSPPYNALCPKDGQTGNRSVAGCPATAMAQILNYLKRTNTTRFDDADDYYHNYGVNNKYWIDNEFVAFDFPSWPQLNEYLDSLEYHYIKNAPLTNTDKAALTFACGVAAKQVYSSSGSGTFGIDQAYDAYQRFGFSQSVLVMPDNPFLVMQLAENVKLGLPAHLGLVNPEVTVGHNVVVDGYNTDEFYHFNFGWGGSANGWYTMPPTEIPYNLTVIEGVVMDIGIDAPPVLVAEQFNAAQFELEYLPALNVLRLSARVEKTQNLNLVFSNVNGQVFLNMELRAEPNFTNFEIPITSEVKGLLILTIYRDNLPIVTHKLISAP